jgi:hypothetical protein
MTREPVPLWGQLYFLKYNRGNKLDISKNSLIPPPIVINSSNGLIFFTY